MITAFLFFLRRLLLFLGTLWNICQFLRTTLADNHFLNRFIFRFLQLESLFERHILDLSNLVHSVHFLAKASMKSPVGSLSSGRFIFFCLVQYSLFRLLLRSRLLLWLLLLFEGAHLFVGLSAHLSAPNAIVLTITIIVVVAATIVIVDFYLIIITRLDPTESSSFLVNIAVILVVTFTIIVLVTIHVILLLFRSLGRCDATRIAQFEVFIFFVNFVVGVGKQAAETIVGQKTVRHLACLAVSRIGLVLKAIRKVWIDRRLLDLVLGVFGSNPTCSLRFQTFLEFLLSILFVFERIGYGADTIVQVCIHEKSVHVPS
mmetsp:Transcript_78513/g.118068  ORF Transcript_78513/g.118068 Transcript_78513/m.118068 type:complete len:317 (+) Transcript_78513:124-1074(+)